MAWSLAEKINVVRAGVMGANDGIVSIAGIVFGVAGATQNTFAIFISGISGALAGIFSMGAGEYVSVHTQKDTEEAAANQAKQQLQNKRASAEDDVVGYYHELGMQDDTARAVAKTTMARDDLSEVLEANYSLRKGEYTNPVHAAVASMVSFALASLLPLLGMTAVSADWRVPVTLACTTLALMITGYVPAYLNNCPKTWAVIRNVAFGLATMAITYFIGTLLRGI
jgi:VIT1/CCC1 family predicted Fe2+/Mn2+ transporter